MRLHYVYLLIDPRDDSIFYVGQGVGTRAADHMQKALDWKAAGCPLLPPLGAKTPEERTEKLKRILEILESNEFQQPLVEFLRTNLSQEQADLVETVAIDLIGLKALTNQVHGPMGSERTRASLFEILANATTKTLVQAAVVVPTKGIRGDFNEHGGMLEADPATALQNAETIWNVAAHYREMLNARGTTDVPVLLIGIQSGDSLLRAKGLVVGIWEIESCQYDGPKFKNQKSSAAGEQRSSRKLETNGYKFVVKSAPSEELVSIREELMWNRLIDTMGNPVRPQPGPTYKNWPTVITLFSKVDAKP